METLMAEVELVPMDMEEFEAYLDRAIPRYAAETVKAGYRTSQEAVQRAKEDHDRLLPAGLGTPDNHLLVIRRTRDGQKVGTVWLRVDRGERPTGFVYDVFIDEGLRGKGLGKATMRAMESLAKSLGLRALYLHVFAHNPVALRLYEGEGYRVRSLNMEKALD